MFAIVNGDIEILLYRISEGTARIERGMQELTKFLCLADGRKLFLKYLQVSTKYVKHINLLAKTGNALKVDACICMIS